MWYGVSSDVLDALRRVRARIADPGRWTVGVSARDEHGRPCLYDSGLARQWCLAGAIEFETYDSDHEGYKTLYALVEQGIRDRYGRYIPLDQFNDRYGHLAVLKVLDDLIVEIEEPTP